MPGFARSGMLALRREPLGMTLTISLLIHALLVFGFVFMPPRHIEVPLPDKLEVRLKLTPPKPLPPQQTNQRKASRPALGAQMSMDEEFSAETSHASLSQTSLASSESTRPQNGPSSERALSAEAEMQHARSLPDAQAVQLASPREAVQQRQASSGQAMLATQADSPLRSSPVSTPARDLAAARDTQPVSIQHASGAALASSAQALTPSREARSAPVLLTRNDAATALSAPVAGSAALSSTSEVSRAQVTRNTASVASAQPSAVPRAMPATHSAAVPAQSEAAGTLRQQSEAANRVQSVATASVDQSQSRTASATMGPAGSNSLQSAARQIVQSQTPRQLVSSTVPTQAAIRTSTEGAAMATSSVASLRQQDARAESAGLVSILGATALDPTALDGRGGDLLFSAALAGDGSDCFSYSRTAQRAGLQGLVVLRVAVDKNGRPANTYVRNSSGQPRLDDLALAQAQRCARFVLQNRRGQPVAGVVDLPIRYRLEGGG